MNTYKLILGDSSGDGHGITDSVNITSNASLDKLAEALKTAEKKTDVIFRSICEEYEDDTLNADVIEKLTPHGFSAVEFSEGIGYEDGIYMDTDKFVDLYIWFVKLCNPEIEISVVDTTGILIGGYGLFAN